MPTLQTTAFKSEISLTLLLDSSDSIQCGRGDIFKAKGGKSGSRSAGGGGGSAEEDKNPVPNGVEKIERPDGYTSYSFKTASGKDVELVVNPSQAYGGANADVEFKVAGSLDRGALNDREARSAALKLARIMQHDVASRPNGYMYSAWAHTDDQYGARRAAAYRAIGFSKPDYEGGVQYAVVRNGKLRPGKER